MSLTLAQKNEFIASTILASIADRPSLFSELLQAEQPVGSLLGQVLLPDFKKLTESEMSEAGPALHARVDAVVAWAKNADDIAYCEFIGAVMRDISALSDFEEFYRTFDAMDEILDLDYSRDVGMKTDSTTPERLYEGAGVGVQSSYTTLLALIQQISPAQGASFIVLGSGYGRAGLVVGLLRPDMEFIGYEYVEHRIEVSVRAAQRAGLSNRVKFYSQDLADPDFVIPVADIYYLFDPFTEDTYTHVFTQLKDIGRKYAITVAAKGGAAVWFEKAIVNGGWSNAEKYDVGTLSLFRSKI
jgi:hypothetical protein